MSDFPATVPAFPSLVDQQDDVLAAHQNVPNDEISALATMVGALGKGQSWAVDLISASLNGTPPICVKASVSTITVKPGVCWVGNSGQSFRLPRRNTADVTVTAADIDTGSLADDTYYYVYAVADSVGTTFTVKFSLSSTAPTGLTSFELIGWFYNESAGSLDITSGFIGNVRKGLRTANPNGVSITAATDITTVSTSYVDMTDMTARFYSNGRPVLINFCAPFNTDASAQQFSQILIDASSKKFTNINHPDSSIGDMCLVYMETLSAGTHTISIQWKTVGGTGKQRGATDGQRVLTVIEL